MLPNPKPLILKNGVRTQDVILSEHHIFTTVRILMGKVVLWDWHEKRLVHDTQHLGTEWIKRRIDIIESVAAQLHNGAIRVTCTPDSWWVHAWETVIDESKPLRTSWIEWEHRAVLPACTKHGYRSTARQKAKSCKVDVLLWKNKHGEALEASFGNLFSIVGGCIYTPPAKGSILNGIGRRTLIHVATSMGIRVHETPVPVEAGGWWMTSALRGIQQLDISTNDAIVPILRKEISAFIHSTLSNVRDESKALNYSITKKRVGRG